MNGISGVRERLGEGRKKKKSAREHSGGNQRHHTVSIAQPSQPLLTSSGSRVCGAARRPVEPRFCFCFSNFLGRLALGVPCAVNEAHFKIS